MRRAKDEKESEGKERQESRFSRAQLPDSNTNSIMSR